MPCSLVVEGEEVRLYHSMDNSRRYHGREPQWFELDEEQAGAVEDLLRTYPNYLAVEALPLALPSRRLELASLLYERALLITKEPLPAVDSD